MTNNITEVAKKKLRLILFPECNRKCSGCCNKDWNITELPVCVDFSGYDEYLLTGGEPMLKQDVILDTVQKIRKVSTGKIFLYTAMVQFPYAILSLLEKLDGITITLHDQKDVIDFIYLDSLLKDVKNKNLRLNVFKEVHIPYARSAWKLKDNITWIKNCPLPEGEVLMKL